MKNILFPTDFSPNADHALTFAEEILRHSGASITLMHIYQLPVIDPNMPVDALIEMEKEAKLYAEQKMNSKRDEVQKRHPALTVSALVQQGLVIDAVTDYAEKNEVDLIVMGTAGANQLKQIFMGSNTAAVIDKAHCPVLSVPADAQWKNFKKLIFAAEFSDSDVPALQMLMQFSKSFNSEITVLHVENLPSESFSEIKNIEARYRSLVHFSPFQFEVIPGDDVEHTLHEFAANNNADLICLFRHKRSFWERLIHPSLSKRLSYHSHIPMLVFH